MRWIRVVPVAMFGLAACVDEAPGPGRVDVEYQFQGAQAPERVDLYLIRAADADCAKLDDPAPIATDSIRSLPENGRFVFDNLDPGTRWTLAATGMAAGAQVADGCVDGLQVTGDQTTYTSLTLKNHPMDLHGAYDNEMAIDVGLPVQPIGGLMDYDLVYDAVVDFVCQVRDTCPFVGAPGDDSQQVATQVLTLLDSLDVQASWDLTQHDDLLRGTMTWTSVDGIQVDSQWNLVEGGLDGEIPGSTQIVLTTNDMRIRTDQLILFLMDQVLGETVNTQADQADPQLPDMVFEAGSGVGIDDNFDGQADRFAGAMPVSMDFASISLVHRFEVDWTADRTDSGN